MSVSESLDSKRMAEIAEGLPSKSEKIRRLGAAGFETADIARFLGIRYQFAYNVLAAANERAGVDVEPMSASEALDSDWEWVKLEKGGRISLPNGFAAALGLAEGDDVQLRLAGDRIEVLTRREALRSLQEDVRRYVPEGRSLVDELIAERRAEAEDESEE